MITKKCCLPSCSIGTESQATVTTDLQYILKGVHGEYQNEILCALGKLAEQSFRQLDIIRRICFYEPICLHLSIFRKALKSLTKVIVPQRLAVTFYWDLYLVACTSFTKIIHTHTHTHTYTHWPPPLPAETVPQSSLRGCLSGYSP